jgi:hypothetical protein
MCLVLMTACGNLLPLFEPIEMKIRSRSASQQRTQFTMHIFILISAIKKHIFSWFRGSDKKHLRLMKVKLKAFKAVD